MTIEPDNAGQNSISRHIDIGPVRLDLFHRDACVAAQWLRLHPREFEVLWRLAESQGTSIPKRQMLEEIWRITGPSESNRVEVHISRIRAKLHVHRLSWLVETDPAGGYRLSSEAVQPKPALETLDSYLIIGNDGETSKHSGDPHELPEKRTRMD